ncbi:S41 family peptidase [Candidatus Saccharibacteria bacterium]|nr:S41 family peptidase [Candidatus Saccharibacteria bacterium]
MSNKVEWKAKNINLGGAIVIAAVCAVMGVALGMTIQNFDALSLFGFGEESYKGNWSQLDEVYSRLMNNYNGEIDFGVVVEGAKKGMVEALGDQYTIYMTPEENQSFMDDLHGNVGSGIGIEMGLRDGYVRVLRTLPDNPARKAGLLAGDIIYKVDGEEVWELSSDEIANRVRGAEGSEVTVTVVRDGEELSYTMKRETINNVSEYVEFDGSTAIITLTRFDSDTGKLVQNEVEKFAEKGIDKVILDLRNNGGGYVSAAQELLSLWIDGQIVYRQKSKNSGDTVSYASSGKALLKDMKTIVLINGSTASASEIVAGALQDYGKATIVGEQSYGKGVVQSLMNLSNGATLKVTTADWYTPNGNSINQAGITPDIVVERTYDDINKMLDPQLDKAKEL